MSNYFLFLSFIIGLIIDLYSNFGIYPVPRIVLIRILILCWINSELKIFIMLLLIPSNSLVFDIINSFMIFFIDSMLLYCFYDDFNFVFFSLSYILTLSTISIFSGSFSILPVFNLNSSLILFSSNLEFLPLILISSFLLKPSRAFQKSSSDGLSNKFSILIFLF